LQRGRDKWDDRSDSHHPTCAGRHSRLLAKYDEVRIDDIGQMFAHDRKRFNAEIETLKSEFDLRRAGLLQAIERLERRSASGEVADVIDLSKGRRRA
jgi:hypothetical protein